MTGKGTGDPSLKSQGGDVPCAKLVDVCMLQVAGQHVCTVVSAGL